MFREESPSSKRLYLRNLPKHVNEESLFKYLSSYGKIAEVKIIHDYAFVQFDLEQDARDVVKTFRSQPFLGKEIVVEFARPLRKDMPSLGSSSNSSKTDVSILSRLAPTNVQSRYPIVITNIPKKVRWQELKDFGRMTGALVAYCDLDKNRRGRGFIEYFSTEDARRAIRDLDGRLLGGKPVTVSGSQEYYSRGRRSRSRSPERCEKSTHRWPPPQYTDHSFLAHSYKPDAHKHHYQESPPPSYDHRNSPLSYHYSQQQSSRYYPSPPLSSPTERVSIPDPPTHYPAATYPPVDPAYCGAEEQYDYAGHSMRLDTWKYDYDREYDYDRYDPRRESEPPLDVDRREQDYQYYY